MQDTERFQSDLPQVQELVPKRRGFSMGKLFHYRSSASHDPVTSSPQDNSTPLEGECESDSGEVLGRISSGVPHIETPSSGISLLQHISFFTTRALSATNALLQKWNGHETFHNVHEFQERLEKAAAELRGKDRDMEVMRWCDLLEEATPTIQLPTPPNLYSPKAGTSPGVEGPLVEGEWHQLQAPTSPMAGPRTDGARPRQGSAYEEQADSSSWMTFREIFLTCRAFEYLIAGYAVSPPTEEEKRTLLRLFGACLVGDQAIHEPIMQGLIRLGEAQVVCRDTGIPLSCLQGLASSVAECIDCIKQQANIEALDRSILAVEGEIDAHASTSSALDLLHSVPVDGIDFSPRKLEDGLRVSAQDLSLWERLCSLRAQRQALSQGMPDPPHTAVLDNLYFNMATVAKQLEEIKEQMTATSKEQAVKEIEKGREEARWQERMDHVNLEISSYEKRKEELLSQLREVESQLAQAHARKTDIEESRNASEDGLMCSISGLQQQSDYLAAEQRKQEAHSAALKAGRAVVEDLKEVAAAVVAKDAAASAAAQRDCELKYLSVAAHHLRFQRRQLQMLLKRAEYCVNAIEKLQMRPEDLEKIGMASMLDKIQLQRNEVQDKFLEAEEAVLKHVKEVEEIQTQIYDLCGVVLSGHEKPSSTLNVPAQAHHFQNDESCCRRKEAVVEELQKLVAGINELAHLFQAISRPEGWTGPSPSAVSQSESYKERAGTDDDACL
eukprot:jgi/Botrbrau1/19394/Bobra.0338s0024.1